MLIQALLCIVHRIRKVWRWKIEKRQKERIQI